MSQVNNNQPTSPSIVDLGAAMNNNLTLYTNVNQELILITKDKLKLVLIDTRASIKARWDWVTPISLLISFVTTLCTADFKETWKIPATTWQAIFLILSVFFAVWFLKSLYCLIINWGNDDLERVIEKIKEKSEPNPGTSTNSNT